MKKLLTLLSILPLLAFGQTPTVRQVTSAGTAITKLPSASTSTVSSTDTIIIFQSPTWKKTTVSAIANTATVTPAWSLTGNSGTVDGTNFIGTTDDIPFNIRVNNVTSGKIDPTLLNSFYGFQSGISNTTGSSNTGIGGAALFVNTTGSNNTAIGYNAGVGSGALDNATAIGAGAQVTASNCMVLGDVSPATKIGIGTTAPTFNLELSLSSTSPLGTIFPLIAARNTSAVLGDGATTFNFGGVGIAAGNGLVRGSLISSYTNNGGSGFEESVILSSSTVHPIRFITQSEISPKFAMKINGTDGFVGIGGYTSTAAGIAVATLDVRGSSGTTLRIQDGNQGGGKVLTSDADGDATWTTPSTSGTAWQLLGNSGTVDGTNFLGTIDNVPLNFRVNNQKAGRIDNTLANVFLGYQAGNSATTSANNVGIGQGSLFTATTNPGGSSNNTAIGISSLYSTTSGAENTAIGASSQLLNTTGIQNTALGRYSLYANQTGSGNVALGYLAGFYETASNSFYVDNQDRTNLATGKTNSLIYGTFNATPSSQTLMVNAVLSTSQVGNSAGNVLTTDGTQTLTNKRITLRESTTASTATVTPSADSDDFYSVTALATNTSFANPSGTPTDGQKLMIRVKSDATPRTLTFSGSQYRASTDLAFPTTTTASKTLYLLFFYNADDTKWDYVAKTDGF